MEPVTVGIPAFNAAPFLKRAVESVRQQEWPIAEILVVDDGSADDTASVAEQLGCRVVVHAANRGDAGARNTVLQNAGSDVLAWLDADDEWLPHHLETVMPVLSGNDRSAGAFALTVARPSGRLWEAPSESKAGLRLLAACLARCLLPQNTLVVRRARVLSVGGYNESLRVASDFELWCRLAMQFDLDCAPVVTAVIHEHPNQSSRQGFRYSETEYAIRRRFLANPEELGVDADWLRQVNNDVWRQHLATSWHGRDARAMAFHAGQYAGHGSMVQAAAALAKISLMGVASSRWRPGRSARV